MRGATRVGLQLHQILRLPRKWFMIDPRRIWNVSYNARSNKSHLVTSANTAPATQNESHDWSASRMKHHLHCAEQQESASNFNKYCACHAKGILWMIRITYEMSFTVSGATGVKSSSNFTKYCTCHEKWISWLSSVTYETLFTMRGATRVTLQLHQILRLPRNSEFKTSAENPWIASANIKTIRRPSEQDPSMIRR